MCSCDQVELVPGGPSCLCQKFWMYMVRKPEAETAKPRASGKTQQPFSPGFSPWPVLLDVQPCLVEWILHGIVKGMAEAGGVIYLRYTAG